MATNASKQRTLVECWNANYPAGTPVYVTRDGGTVNETVTTSAAWMLGDDHSGRGGHTAVIMVNGISGCYRLDRITFAPEQQITEGQ